MSERKYIAISMKHSTKDCFMLWGYKRTEDNEERCYSGYTATLSKCELYSKEEFLSHYGHCNYPVIDGEIRSISYFRKQYGNYDTVLVPLESWRKLMKEEEIRCRNRRRKRGVNVLKEGDIVVMHTCMEAIEHEGRLWECECDSWDDYGTEMVMLKGYSGSFYTQYLQKVDTRIDKTINRHEAVVRINREFKEFLERRYPNMDSYTFALMVDSFQKGFEKGTALTFNAFSSDIKLCVFNDDVLPS